MGGRGNDVGSNNIAFIHASDGETWAQFLQKVLRGPDYSIDSAFFLPDQEETPKLFTKSQTCAVLVSPAFLEGNYSDFWRKCVDNFHSRTVVMLLGVDTSDLRASLGNVTDRVLHQKWLEMDGSRQAVSTALVKLIEAYEAVEHTSQTEKSEYEDEEDVYDRPPPPRQQNGVLKVVPSVLYEQSSQEIVVVLEQQAGGEVCMVTEGGGGPSRHIPMTHITGTAYSAELTVHFRGNVSFRVLAGELIIGEGSVVIHSRAEQLADLLLREANPLSLLCAAMGLSATRQSEAEELDTMLASRLAGAPLPLGLTSLLMPDENNMPEEHENSRWPTLLHFSAEYNLSKLCEELLKYPSMIHAAVTENIDGLYPCQLAEKHGFTALQQQLVKYVEDMRLRSAADSGISFDHFPAPSPHTPKIHQYANDPQNEPAQESVGDFDDEYMDMTSFMPSYGYAKPRSYSDGNLVTPYSRQSTASIIIEEDDPDAPPPLNPKAAASRSMRMCVPSSRRSKSESADKSENETESSGESAPETVVSRLSVAPELHDSLSADQSSSRPSSETSQTSQISSGSQSDYEVPLSHDSEGVENPDISAEELPAVMRGKTTKRNKSVQDKISHFFKKIKSRKQRTESEGDVSASAKSGKKTIFYRRQSTSSNSSDPTGYPTVKKSDSQRSSSSASNVENERDSGAVCDEHGSPVLLRSIGPITAKARGSGKKESSMDRRLSVRVQKAKKEEISETPILPSRSSKGSSFVSYVHAE